MIKDSVRTILTTGFSRYPLSLNLKKVIPFVGEEAGVASLNAGSMYGYGQSRALFLQKMPSLALVNTSIMVPGEAHKPGANDRNYMTVG